MLHTTDIEELESMLKKFRINYHRITTPDGWCVTVSGINLEQEIYVDFFFNGNGNFEEYAMDAEDIYE